MLWLMSIGRGRLNTSRPLPALLDARHQRITNPHRANPERIHRDPEALRQLATPIDLLSPYVGVVLDDQFPLFRPERLQAVIEAIEAVFADGCALVDPFECGAMQ